MKYYFGKSEASDHLVGILKNLGDSKTTSKVGRLWSDYNSKLKSVKDIKNTHNAICLLKMLYHSTLDTVASLNLPVIVETHLKNVVSAAHKKLNKKLNEKLGQD